MSKPKVYIIETTLNDYESGPEFHSVYADSEAAELKAAELRGHIENNNDPCDDGELLYSAVQVREVTLN